MKRIISLILTTILLFSISSAFAQDFSSMTDAELKEQYDYIRNELTTRGLKAEKKTVLFEESGIQIYISGEATVEKATFGLSLILPIVIINNNDKNIRVLITKSSVNGWTLSNAVVSNCDIPTGKKSQSRIQFPLKDTDVETIEDFEEVEFRIYVCDLDNLMGEKVVSETNPITVFASTSE